MKKILTPQTGIVFLIAILVAGACTPAELPEADPSLSVVKIKVKAYEENGVNHLKMYDSSDTTKVVVDSLKTYVKDGTEVYWMLAPSSGLEKIKKVKPKKSGGKIMPGRATGFWSQTKYKKHTVPANQKPGDIQEYLIRVKDLEGNRWEIDPYLRIPD